MSKIINGDITKVVKSGIIVQQVNCQGAMGAGVALAILKKWEQVRPLYEDLCNKSDSPQSLLGTMQEIKLDTNLYLINSFSQLDYGTDKKQTDEDLLITNIKVVAKFAADEGKTVYVPYLIGCGLAGGNWTNVYEQLQSIENLVFVKY